MKKTNFLVTLAYIIIASACHSSDSNTTNSPDSTDHHIIHDSTEIAIAKLSFKVGSFVLSKIYDSALMQCDSVISFINRISVNAHPDKIRAYADNISRFNAVKMSIYDSLNDPAHALKAALEALKWSRTSNNSYLQCCDEYYVARESKNMASIESTPSEKTKLARQALQYSFLAKKHMDSTKVMTPDEIQDYFYTLDSGIDSLLKN